MKTKNLIFIFLFIFLISFISATIVLKDDAIFIKYRIANVEGNESVLFDSQLIGNGNVFRATEKFSGNKTIEECQSWNQTDMFNSTCLNWKNITYFQKNTLRHRDSNGVNNFISKIGNAFQYVIPLTPYLKWIKFGEQTITIEGDTSYNSSNTNVTGETGFAHLNVSNSSIVGYWSFDENVSTTTTYDYTNNSIDGTITGAIYNTSAIYGGAMTFDGVNDFINLTNNPSLNLISAFSFSAWINPTNTSGTRVILFRSTSSPYKGYSFEVTTAGKLQMLIDGGTGGAGITTSSSVMSSNTWYFVSLTKTSNTAPKLYVNGAETAYDVTDTVNPTTNTANAIIGGTGEISGWANRRFNGSIDEVMIWNIALNSTEVLAIYNNQTARFHGTGEMLFQNLNFGVNDTTNISLNSCQRNMGSSLRARINAGSYINFDSSCFIQDYNITGNLTNANLTIGFVGGNGTIANTFYTPLVLGNITLESRAGDTTPPSVTILNEFPLEPQNYSSSQRYNFNATITDANTISAVRFEFNNVNYTPVVSGNIYNITLPLSLSAGNYTYKWIANDSSNNLNATEVGSYNISRATSNITTLFNGTHSNVSIEIGETHEVQAFLNLGNLSSAFLNLSVDGINRNSSSVVSNITFRNYFNLNGSFTVNGSYSGNENWTLATSIINVNVSEINVTMQSPDYLNTTISNSSMTFSITNDVDQVIVLNSNITLKNASYTSGGELIVNISERTDIFWGNVNETLDSKDFPYLISSTNSRKVIGSNLSSNINATIEFNIVTNACSDNSIGGITLKAGSYQRIYLVSDSVNIVCSNLGRLRIINVLIVNSSNNSVDMTYLGGGFLGGGGFPLLEISELNVTENLTEINITDINITDEEIPFIEKTEDIVANVWDKLKKEVRLAEGFQKMPLWLILIFILLVSYLLGRFILFAKMEKSRVGFAILLSLMITGGIFIFLVIS